MIRIQQLKMSISHTKEELLKKVTKRLRISKKDITSMEIIRQSVDARKKPELFFVYTIDVEIEDEKSVIKRINDNNIMLTERKQYRFPEMGEQQLHSRPIIVGAGPAGLFCALMLAKAGFKPLILERGDEAKVRQSKVEKFWSTGVLDECSNVQFGEGGAGTFSDGKLNTSVKDPLGRNRKVLEIFVEAGASPNILFQQKPHLGTDVLIDIVETMRKQIIEKGGEFRFNTQVTDILIENNKIVGVETNKSAQERAEVVICAIGHSARDTFALLHEKGLKMAPKSFAVGVRIEHPQTMINKSQYGQEDVPKLGAADYKLTHQTKDGRGVYSFCMCPGGYVVNASSKSGMLAINGMSYDDRGSANANSAIVVTVSPEDYENIKGQDGQMELRGVAFQEQLEKQMFNICHGKIPVQLFEDFKTGKESTAIGDVKPCIKGEWELANLSANLPKIIKTSVIEGVDAFDKKIKGFARPDAIISGIESRTSSPVRIIRDDNLESNIVGIYPCGEGAGYAGGITSAAIDGIKIAEIIQKKYKNLI